MIKILFNLVAALALVLAVPTASFAQAGFVNEKFQKTIYVASGTREGNGSSYAAPILCDADSDLWVIPAGTVIEKVFVVIDTAITGTTNLDIGDDDDADGFVDSSLSVTLGTPGMYGWDAKLAGAYLRVQTAGGTDPADIYVVPAAKYYAAAGKELKMDLTTACSAGRFRVVVEGYYLGTK